MLCDNSKEELKKKKKHFSSWKLSSTCIFVNKSCPCIMPTTKLNSNSSCPNYLDIRLKEVLLVSSVIKIYCLAFHLERVHPICRPLLQEIRPNKTSPVSAMCGGRRVVGECACPEWVWAEIQGPTLSEDLDHQSLTTFCMNELIYLGKGDLQGANLYLVSWKRR